MIAVRIRVHDLDGGQMVPEYVGGSIPALKCRRCDRFVAKEATRLVERYDLPRTVRDLAGTKVQVVSVTSEVQVQ
ncbi:MAG: hypothetical protein E6K18_08090 [Methanobacteriota archaeon]|nr:MAG: hypothetical protein E6K18_08090 [Euryarchaeota archaeon]